jgi:hypothetical protein
MTKDLRLVATGLNGFSHPLRIKLIVLLEREHSPSELCGLLPGEPLGVVSYHVRMLKQYGLLTETKTRPRRGALEHFYARTPLADVLLETLAPLLKLPAKPKRRGGGRPSAAAVEARERALLNALGVEPASASVATEEPEEAAA